MICLVNPNSVADPQSETFNDIQVMQISMIDGCAVNDHILELSGDGYHAGAGGGQFKAEELGFIQFISPFERHYAIFMMARRAQALTIGDIVIFDDKPIHGIGTLCRFEPVDDRSDLRLCGQIAQGEMMHHIESQIRQESKLLMLHGEAVT